MNITKKFLNKDRHSKTVLLLSGGARQFRVNQNLLKIIENLEFRVKLIVLGESKKYSFNKFVKYYSFNSNLEKYINEADLIVSPASTVALECLAAKKFIGIYKFTNNQKDAYSNLISSKYAFPLSKHNASLDIDELKKFVTLDSKNLRKIIKKSNLDFKGAARTFNQIIKSVNSLPDSK